MKDKPNRASKRALKLKPYDPAAIEPKWQKKWASQKLYKTQEAGKDKYYVLDMFPYPSGEGLHVGHPKGYIATDVISRMKRMQGLNVLHPMGFDAFGLPAENYAIKTKTNPADSVKKNVKRYKEQLEMLGFDYDWSREINTTDPAYYKWTQWIFLQLFKKGLAYESFEPINWCPTCKTGLANEDLENGRCERCGTPVEKKPMRQWVLKITDYADRLLKDLDATDYVLPKVVDHTNPHRPELPTVTRRVAHAIVFDPKTKKYLAIRNHKFGWDSVVIGGIEGDESAEAAARREVREETGYTDLEFKRVLGLPTEAHYCARHKGQNRIAIAEAIYFELKSDARVPIAEDEAKHNEVIWVEEKDFVPGKLCNSELPIWLERMNAKSFEDPKTGIMCFEDTSPVSSVRHDKPVVERNALTAVVKHWKEDKYIALKWKQVAWKTLITGGPEGDESLEDAARREIIEETGYLHPKLVKKLGKSQTTFFHNPKDVNRLAYFEAFYFELEDGERQELSADEDSKHEVVWLGKDEMSDFITPTAQRYIWDVQFRGMYNRFAPPKPLLDWPEAIKESQRNWIGRSEGALVTFRIKGNAAQSVDVFTTRIDTIFSGTYVIVAPEHPFLHRNKDKITNWGDVAAYVLQTSKASDIERTSEGKDWTGVELKGLKAVNPATGEPISIWVADFVLGGYGTGAVFADAHDSRDFFLARKYGIPLKASIAPDKGSMADVSKLEKCFEGEGVLFDSKQFDGLTSAAARPRIIDWLKEKGLADRKVSYKLRDWVFSRQRYWGEPIPLIHCQKCGVVPVPEKDLPVVLPKVKSYEPTGTGESPLAAIAKWVNVKCPECGGPARRETNTMPQWAGSSWYYLRYEDVNNKKAPVALEKERYWSPVDLYVGGAEHATRHLIYARFWHKFLYDIGVVGGIEPFKKLQSVGLIMGEDGRKMGKRFGNVVNPDDVVKTFGADTLRLYEMFMGPFDQQIAWSTSSMTGPRRFIERVWKLAEKVESDQKTIKNKLHLDGATSSGDVSPASLLKSVENLDTFQKSSGGHVSPAGSPGSNTHVISRILHRTIKKVTEDIESMRFNTAISCLMIAANEFEKADAIDRGTYESYLKLLAPFAPHATEELWISLGNKRSIHISEWPAYDPAFLVDDEATIILQVNGKTRGSFKVQAGAGKDELEKIARESPEARKWIEGKEIKRIVTVPGKLVNIVAI